jgi:hypothetical protein
MTIMISAIKKELIPLVWHTVEDRIKDAIQYSNGEMSIEHAKKDILSGEMMLILVMDDDVVIGVITGEKRYFPTGKTILNMTTAGGKDCESWFKELGPALDKIAIENDCEEIYIVGRPAWQKLLKEYGYSHVHTIVGKKVGV